MSFFVGRRSSLMQIIYFTVILRGRAGYELIYITNEAVAHIRQVREE